MEDKQVASQVCVGDKHLEHGTWESVFFTCKDDVDHDEGDGDGHGRRGVMVSLDKGG